MSLENINLNNANLNLARKWRSKSFDQIIGQELSVRILKNSLYLNKFFPVYLFSGQHGCGKTSTARVFAAAVNCDNLPNFQKNPKTSILPCLECVSCKAMLDGNHPDFIEIDAASNTGVDNVRQIIESSSFMPLVGNKKIYLVDEAHMLSKAAFNAFLKIMEEPPDSVIFILATTNSQKIIETVKSRCLQLFFGSVGHKNLVDYLKNICEQEKIAYDLQGLSIIVNEAQGSVRDSLNILEQVRFSACEVTKSSVQNILGHIDDESLFKLFECLLNCGVRELLTCIKSFGYELFSPQYLWKKIIDLTRDATWVKHGVIPNDGRIEYYEKISKIVARVSLERLNYIMQLFYDNEDIFNKTTEKHSLLEMIFIQISKKNDKSNKSGASCAPNEVPVRESQDFSEYSDEDDVQEQEEQEDDIDGAGTQDFVEVINSQEPSLSVSKKAENLAQLEKEKNNSESNLKNKSENSEQENLENNNCVENKTSERKELAPWDEFLVNLQANVPDQLLNSIFKNGEFIKFDAVSGNLEVKFAKKFSFFEDTLKNTENLWLPILKQLYTQDVKFGPVFTGDDKVSVAKNSPNRVGGLQKRGDSGVKDLGQGDTSSGQDGSVSASSNKKSAGPANKSFKGASPAGNYPASYSDFKKNMYSNYNKARSGSGKNSKSVSASKINAGKPVDVSDVATWKKANTILKYFSGNIVESKEGK